MRKIVTPEPPKIAFDPSKLKLVDPRTLKLDPKNRNKHSDKQILRLRKLYRKFGMRWPVLVSERTGFVKAGEGRLLAAIAEGMPEVLVSYQEFESAEEEYAFGISDNAISAWAQLDLDSIEDDLTDLGEDFDIDLLGIEDLNFGTDDLDADDDSTLVDEVNRGSESDEWVGLPDFETGGKYINLTYQFKTEEERAVYCAQNNIKIDKKNCGQWIVYFNREK